MLGVILVYTIQGIIFGAITRYVADSKGYDGGFWWGFFLGIIGLLVVGFRPNQTAQPASSASSAYWDNLQDNASGSTKHAMWRCVCGTENPVTLSYCTRCRRTRKETDTGTREKCPHCGAMNRSDNATCFACGQPIHEENVPAQKELPPVKETTPAQTQQEALALLESLSALHQQGILTDDEFAEKKKQILSRI